MTITKRNPTCGLDNLKALQYFSFDYDKIKSLPPLFFSFPVSNAISYTEWIKSCCARKDTTLLNIICKGIENKELNEYTWRNISYILFFEGKDIERAVWAAQKSQKLDKTQSVAYQMLALSYLYNGQYKRSLFYLCSA